MEQITTWKYFPSGTLRAYLARWICSKVIKHDFANGESCRGLLDGTETKWCRWCNQSFTIWVNEPQTVTIAAAKECK